MVKYGRCLVSSFLKLFLFASLSHTTTFSKSRGGAGAGWWTRDRAKQCFCLVFVLFFVLFLLVLVVLVVVLVLLGVVLVIIEVVARHHCYYD